MITIEKIDAVMAATGRDYSEVRQALVASDGDVAAAVRALLGHEAPTAAGAGEAAGGGFKAGVDRFFENLRYDPTAPRGTEQVGETGEAAERRSAADGTGEPDPSAAGAVEDDGEYAESVDADAEGGPESAAEGTKTGSARATLDEVIDAIRALWRTGNASSLIIEKDGQVLLNLSLTVSVFALVIAPFVSIIGLGAAFLTEYTIKVIMDNGEEINVLSYTMKHRAGREHYRKDAAEQAQAEATDEANEEADAQPEAEAETAQAEASQTVPPDEAEGDPRDTTP